MCARLVRRGHSVWAHDIDAAALSRIVNDGAVSAASAAEAADEAEIVFTCLPSPPDVTQAVVGDDGILERAKSGAMIVDLSTNDPIVAQRLAAQARDHAIGFADAPVSGGVPRAIDGTLTFMVGAQPEEFGRIQPLLGALGSQIFHLGPVGTGSIAKLANNLLAMCNLAAAHEVFMTAKRCGLPPERLLSVLEVSSGESAVLALIQRKIFVGDFSPDFTLDMAYKDLALALDLGERTGVPMSFGGLLKGLLQQARARGYGTNDAVAMVRVLEDIMGDSVRAEISIPQGD
jgi:3-hydroxyisobutyrate dehydrogenase-like beta-hydroxyacid dehydrogenase